MGVTTKLTIGAKGISGVYNDALVGVIAESSNIRRVSDVSYNIMVGRWQVTLNHDILDELGFLMEERRILERTSFYSRADAVQAEIDFLVGGVRTVTGDGPAVVREIAVLPSPLLAPAPEANFSLCYN